MGFVEKKGRGEKKSEGFCTEKKKEKNAVKEITEEIDNFFLCAFHSNEMRECMSIA